jgi:hypothetical protein
MPLRTLSTEEPHPPIHLLPSTIPYPQNQASMTISTRITHHAQRKTQYQSRKNQTQHQNANQTPIIPTLIPDTQASLP